MRVLHRLPLLAALAIALPAHAETDHRLAFFAGGGWWPHPERGGHGLFGAAWDVDGLPLGAHVGLAFNTDTLRLAFDRVRLADGLLETGLRLSGELRFAGLLMDHWREGRNDKERGLLASFVHAEVHLKANLPADHHLELALGVRRWFFDRQDAGQPALVLPPEAWVLEPRLRYTFWRLSPDAAWRDRQRLFPRVDGLAVGVELGLDRRSRVQPWGALDPAVFAPVDGRNDPGAWIVLVRQWLRWGWQLHDRVRVQLAQTLAWGRGEDDLTRVRLGGLNPYVVPIGGVPWAGFVSEKFLAVESSWHLGLVGRLEAGPFFQAALIEDAQRRGREDVYGTQVGLGAFVDFRLGAIQVDVRAGWSPTYDERSAAGAFSLFAAAGWQWD